MTAEERCEFVCGYPHICGAPYCVRLAEAFRAADERAASLAMAIRDARELILGRQWGMAVDRIDLELQEVSRAESRAGEEK